MSQLIRSRVEDNEGDKMLFTFLFHYLHLLFPIHGYYKNKNEYNYIIIGHISHNCL